MLDLSKTTDLVKEQLENDLYLLEILHEDLVNVSALARKLLPILQKENPKVTIESISIAIKRYVDKTKKESVSRAVKNIIAQSQLSTKNDVIHITFKRNDFILQQLSEVSKKIKWDEEEIFFINQGSGEVTLIIDSKSEHLLDGCKKYQIERTKGLSVISIRENQKISERSIEYPGIYAHFTNRLARNGINLVSVVSTYTQITFAFKKKEFIRAYQVLQEAIDFFRK